MAPEFTNASGVMSFFLLAVFGLLLLVLVTRSARTKEALKLVSSAPAFLVPAAMVACTVAFSFWLLPEQSDRQQLSENPWGDQLGHTTPSGWILLIVTALCVAGQIGLLEASAAGRRPNSDAFLKGLKRHAFNMLAGKILISLLTYLIISWFAPVSIGLVVYMVPSILLAPLLGITSQHPGKPHKALPATFHYIQENMAPVARFVTAQTLFLFGLFFFHAQLASYGPLGWNQSMAMLGQSNSALSYNPYPYAVLPSIPALRVLMVILSAFASTVFISAHWLGVHKGYLSSSEQAADRRDGLSD